ncbi:MAG TPA: ABC transporter permease subunit [Candidatus Binatia bacterium]|nr:ABC transporter permease subunit [Candidatus Binatia bacterium]
MNSALLRFYLRTLLGRRRVLAAGGFCLLPVVVAGLVRLAGSPGEAEATIVNLSTFLVVAVVLPIVALVFGTAVIGSAIEDRTIVYLLATPVERWRLAVLGVVVAVGLTVGFVVAGGLAAVVLLGVDRGLLWPIPVLGGGWLLGALCYGSLFVALGTLTSRALVIGLLYVSLWEGSLSSLFPGAGVVSVRRYIEAVTGGLGDLVAVPASTLPRGELAPLDGALLAVVVTLVALVVAARRVERLELAGVD